MDSGRPAHWKTQEPKDRLAGNGERVQSRWRTRQEGRVAFDPRWIPLSCKYAPPPLDSNLSNMRSTGYGHHFRDFEVSSVLTSELHL